MTIPPAPLVRSVPEDVSAFLAEHPDLDTLEVVLPDINSVLRGKWMPGAAVTKVFESGVAFPFSLFGLDVWGREVEETGLHIETGDKDGVCWPVDGFRLVASRLSSTGPDYTTLATWSLGPTPGESVGGGATDDAPDEA